MTRTPSDLRAAMLAREGTEDGEILWPLPWRVRKAIWVPVGREQIVIGELGNPHGWNYPIVSSIRVGIWKTYCFWVDMFSVLHR